MTSRRAEAIVARGIIRPVGIAEVERAVGEVETLQRNPASIRVTCAASITMGIFAVLVMVNPNRFVRTPKLASRVCTSGFHRRVGAPPSVAPQPVAPGR